MLGKTISHYKILEKLGEGGMGVVYKAEDTKLQRIVALKFLPTEFTRDAEAKKRFIREAQAASFLEHTNICNIHEIDETDDGQMFIVMACYEGELLKDKIARGPLPLSEAIDYASQIANGLTKAHEKNIVHRDIKSANIQITNDNIVKILDFGLAKLGEKSQLTKEHTTMGTVAYMSPEQIRGQEVDSRSDIWSLGVVLYEMITGQLPFKGEYESAMQYSILNENPDPITFLRSGLPLELERIANKALAKNADERYQHVDEMIVDLRAVHEKSTSDTETKPSAPKKPKNKKLLFLSIGFVVVLLSLLLGKYFLSESTVLTIDSLAVLPFDNLSAEPDQNIWAAQITEALRLELSGIHALQRVTSRTSTLRYKDHKKSMPEIAQELNVQALVEGSVVQHGDSIRIIVYLFDGPADKSLWSDEYVRDIDNLFSLQKEIAQDIAKEINLTLTIEEKARFTRKENVDPEAYRLYLWGRYFRTMQTEGKKAKEFFQQAIEKDPNFAPSYVGLAYCYWAWEKDASKAEASLAKALELDVNLSYAYVIKGLLNYNKSKLASVETELKRAIKLNPNNSEAHFEYGLYLMRTGEIEAAISELEHTLRLDPFSFIAQSYFGECFYYARQYDKAIEYSMKAHVQNNQSIKQYEVLIKSYIWKGMYEKAYESFELGRKHIDAMRYYEKIIDTYIQCLSGDHERAGESIEYFESYTENNYELICYIAMFYSILDEKEQAIEWLYKLSGHFREMSSVKLIINDPAFDNIRSEPRFKEFLVEMKRQIGLIE